MMANEVVVKVADLNVGLEGDVLVTYGLGSCVAIMLFDPTVLVGGMAHILLPTPALAKPGASTRKFPETAIPALLDAMVEVGASPKRVVAKLAGGAAMFTALVPAGTMQMGERNVTATRKALNAHNIPVMAEAIGGTYGRSVRFDVTSGVVSISSVNAGVEEI
jgi:chemotaxis protein CheD